MPEHSMVSGIDPTSIVHHLNQDPIKLSEEDDPILVELLEQQLKLVQDNLVPVNYYKVHGTCIEDRKRIGLLSGDAFVEPRPSVPAGPNGYALAVMELINYFPDDSMTSSERLHISTQSLTRAGIISGGHLDCKANRSFKELMQYIASNPDAIKSYTKQQKADLYDDTAMNIVISNAAQVVARGTYDNWDEQVLIDELGDKAGQAIETLPPIEHESAVLIRNKIPNVTIDQTRVYEDSVVGRGVFDMDDDYADTIEHIVTVGTNASRQKILAEHAREAILAAIAAAVPNPVLYQATLDLDTHTLTPQLTA